MIEIQTEEVVADNRQSLVNHNHLVARKRNGCLGFIHARFGVYVLGIQSAANSVIAKIPYNFGTCGIDLDTGSKNIRRIERLRQNCAVPNILGMQETGQSRCLRD